MRLLLIVFPRPSDDDAGIYLELGRNLFHRGIYGIAHGGALAPSLFRLPGYPLFLASCEQLFTPILHGGWWNAVFALQAVADLAAGLLLAAFARRHLGSRVGQIVLALAMLCPFTAAYTGIAMTECLSVFAISLGIYAAGKALSSAQTGHPDYWALILAGLASGLAMLLRPDGVLLTAVLAVGLFVYTARFSAPTTSRQFRSALVSSTLFCLVALSLLAPWTVRNWTTFHLFQSLAPRRVNDPGERVNLGFYHWVGTWSVEYVSTANVFWSAGSDSIDIDDLPSRAFDSPQQRDQTRQLLDDYNRTSSISPGITLDIDARFAALAAERIRSHPLLCYLQIPLLRVADMFLRPRTEAFSTSTFPLDIYWWHYAEHPFQTVFAALLAAINLGYVALAAWAFLRRRVPFAWMLGGYIVLRCLLLATMENPEPRYSLECFPILIVAAGAAFASRQEPDHGNAHA
ncbi:MAG: glycosyltransferase family 39 protein [Terracidiphilus sp.]